MIVYLGVRLEELARREESAGGGENDGALGGGREAGYQFNRNFLA